MPELKRVIVSFGNRLVMEENLDRALASVLGEQTMPTELAAPARAPIQDGSNLGTVALKHYTKAREHLREGNWAEYGKELEKLEEILEEMAGVGKKE